MEKNIKKTIKTTLNKVLYRNLADSESYVKYLKKINIEVGGGTIFYNPRSTVVDIQNPYMLKIGSNVRITGGVTILTHDYSWSVLAGVYGECLGQTVRKPGLA